MKVKLFSDVADQMAGRRGWFSGEGDVAFHHPQLGSVTHVAICRDDGTPMWDQFIHFEPIGAITVPINTQGQFGLVQVERPSFKPGANQKTFPGLNLNDLGAPSWEFPRGFPKKGEEGDQTAKREGEEELGSPIKHVKLIGHLTPNTTFHPHRIPVYRVAVDENSTSAVPLDVNEKILKVNWIHFKAVREMIVTGKIYCAMTLAALALYDVSLPSPEEVAKMFGEE